MKAVCDECEKYFYRHCICANKPFSKEKLKPPNNTYEWRKRWFCDLETLMHVSRAIMDIADCYGGRIGFTYPSLWYYFDWTSSPEGHDFWYDVHKAINEDYHLSREEVRDKLDDACVKHLRKSLRRVEREYEERFK